VIATKERPTYWLNPRTNQVMMAPHTQMPPFKGWLRHECRTAGEIQALSRRLSKQEEDKYRKLKVEEHLREKKHLDRIKANCKLRLAKGCISPHDEEVTRHTLKSVERKEETLYRILTENLMTGHLEIEKKEQPLGMAAYAGKKIVGP
jgi:hypothetical protein